MSFWKAQKKLIVKDYAAFINYLAWYDLNLSSNYIKVKVVIVFFTTVHI